jgi:DMSO/TMAO reductase YedYZ heme-binding membrane subunit
VIYLNKLLSNSRFWILTSGIVLSLNIAGFVQFLIPAGSLQPIRIEQWFGFISLGLLYAALLASPLTKVNPELPFKTSYLHARRAIGVLAFYYALLHGLVAFFNQLGGFAGMQYYSDTYRLALLLGAGALAVLAVMTMTSLDWAVKVMGFTKWKLLHRLVYGAGIAVLVHVALIGSHYDGINALSMLTIVGIAFLLWLELQRFIASKRGKV